MGYAPVLPSFFLSAPARKARAKFWLPGHRDAPACPSFAPLPQRAGEVTDLYRRRQDGWKAVPHPRVIIVVVTVIGAIVFTVSPWSWPVLHFAILHGVIRITSRTPIVTTGSIIWATPIRGARRRIPVLVGHQTYPHQVPQPRQPVIHHDARNVRFRDEDDPLLLNEIGVPAPSGDKELPIILWRHIPELRELHLGARGPQDRLCQVEVLGMQWHPGKGHHP